MTIRKLCLILVAVSLLTLIFVGCGDTSEENKTDYPPGTTDELYSESRSDVEIEVFKQEGRVYTVDSEYEIPELSGNPDLVDGKHYKLIADVTFLNGGVAGYVDYPKIDRIISIEEIPSDG